MHGEKQNTKALAMYVNDYERKTCISERQEGIKTTGVKKTMQIRNTGKVTDVLIHQLNTSPNVLFPGN